MKPVHAIASAAHGISERNLSQRLEVPRANDELRQLSETLNEMLSRLDAAFSRITRFTADASHEIRTPIAAIRTTAEVILERHRSPEEYEQMVCQILAESEFTSELIAHPGRETVFQTPASHRFSVGILPNDLTHIFERFYRASNARYINADGSGLDLAIAQGIAHAHHGALEALSLAGEETTFRLTLPLQCGSSTERRPVA
jgi:signal transduction histidine kinase